jgi:hypothetical protein
LALALVLAVAAPVRAEGSAVALDVGDSCVLVAPDGTELVPQGQYSDIEPLGDETPCDFAAYGTGDQSGAVKLLDPEGKPLSDFSYESLAAIGGKICFEQDGFYGVMDQDQRVVVPCQYTSIVGNGEGGYLALTTNPNDERADGVYYIDSNGNETATGIRVLYGLTEFSNGLMPVLSAESGRTGYLNPRGEFAISAQFSYAGPFTGAFADASIDSGTGLIDLNGNWLITPKYEALSLAGSGAVAVAQVDSTRIALIDTKAFQTIKEFTGKDIYFSAAPDSPLITLYLDGTMKLVDLKGNEVLSSSAPDSTALCDGARVILREGPWGEANATLCDLTGKKLAGPYQDIWRVSADTDTPYYAFSSFDTQAADDGGSAYLNEVPGTRKTGLMDQDGKVLWQPADIQELYSPAEGLFTVETTDVAGVMKADGSWLKSYEIPSDDAE